MELRHRLFGGRAGGVRVWGSKGFGSEPGLGLGFRDPV